MADTPHIEEIITREEMAKRQIGVTAISRKCAVALVAFFLLTMLVIPITQSFLDRHALSIFHAIPEAWNTLNQRGLFAANGVLLRAMGSYETELEDRSFVAVHAIPRMQAFYAEWLGVGNEKAYLGRDGWLFFRPGVDSVTGRGFLDSRVLQARARGGDATLGEAIQPDPIPAILDFHQALADRGIHLVVVPVPVKPMIEPEHLSARYKRWEGGALRNLSFDAWMSRLAAEGVDVFDPAAFLLLHKNYTREPVYLDTDTHWKPEAMEIIAEQLASHLVASGKLRENALVEFTRKNETISGMGDIAAMLKLLPDQTLYGKQSVSIHPVAGPDGEPWVPDPTSEILLLGDSFANIYSLDALGWGAGAGFAEQLSFYLRRPLDTILRNDAGSHATRDILARDLAQGRDRLAGKTIVVWQFAERELTVGDWKIIPLPETALPSQDPGTSGFFVPDDGSEALEVTATVSTVSPVPRPGTVPYRDHIFAVHLTAIEGEGLPGNAQALVYLFGMKENQLTDAAAWKVGDRVTLSLRSWNDVAAEYERFNRSEPDDPDLQFELPAWGQPFP